MARLYNLKGWLLAALLFTFYPIFGQEEERILNYETNIKINIDRSLEVEEVIEVQASGDQIKRGIVRRLPRKVKGKNIQYRIGQVLKNGQKEPYHTERSGDNLTIYVGDRDVFINPGIYTYSIQYRVPNEVRLFKDFDEVYWNTIGTDWDFSIDQASCTLQLPEGASIIQKACYTGPYGNTGSDCQSTDLRADQTIRFESTRPFKSREGLTIGVGFSKNVVAPPTFFEKFGASIILGLGVLGLLIYYVFTVFKYGIDPPKPVAIPIYEAPDKLSPASLAYIKDEKYTPACFTASIINLATKGYIYIEEASKNYLIVEKTTYTLIRKEGNGSSISPEELTLLTYLFKSGNSITLEGKYNSTLKKAYDKHKESLKKQHHAFVKEGNNRKFLAIPILSTIILGIIAIVLINRSGGLLGDEGILILFLFFLAIPLYAMFSAFRARNVSTITKIFLVPFFLVFILGAGGSLFAIGFQPLRNFMGNPNGADLNVTVLALFVVFSIISILVYAYLIKKPSVEKQNLQSAIKGFHLYLSMAEKERLNLLNPPNRTPKHFEALLPFAYATGVAHKWSASFKEVLEKNAYEPKWSNNQGIYHSSSFSNDFSRSITSASTPPSSSGSGGGGFSGGGGGGGGGGGW